MWINPDDDPAFLRAVTTPKRGIGHQTLAQLGEFAGRMRVSLFEALFLPSLVTAMSTRALHGLHEFGRQVQDWSARAAQSHGQAAGRAFLNQWLDDLNYEQHLHDGDDNAKLSAARWEHVQDFCDWMAKRAGGEVDDPSGALGGEGVKSLLEVAQSISLISTLSEREQDQNVVTLSTLHAAKGLEWPHVFLAGVNEGLLPFRSEDALDDDAPDGTHEAAQLRIEEERRLMYVGITRAQRSLMVSWLKRRKKGREYINGKPSRFIAEMQLDAHTQREDPREKLKALRAEFALRAGQE